MIVSRKTLLSLTALFVSAPIAAFAADSVKIGYQLPLTGSHSQYGQGFKDAAEIALSKFNASGKLPVPVEIIFEDSRSDAKEGITIARKFVDDDEIVGVLGDFTSTVSMAAAQVYRKSGMVQLSQTASHPDFAKISKWQFRNITTQNQEGAVNAEWLMSKGIKKVAVIAEQSDWGQSVVKGFEKPFTAAGGEVVYTEFFNRGLADFRSIITKIADQKPDAVYTGFFYEDGAQFLKQMKQLDVSIPIYSTSAAYNDKLIELAGDAADGLFLTVTFLPNRAEPHVQEFVSEWKKTHDLAPGQFPAQAYDAVNIMLDAVVKAYPDITRESLREAVAQTKNFPGVTGDTSFDENGEPEKQLAKATVESGAFKEMK
nr:ABC transporter substrate-binding protein [uncultured Cohaesibacter sp.]